MKRKGISRIMLVSIIVAVIIVAGVAYMFVISNQNQSTTSTQKIRISGAGSTFVAYFMQTAAYHYAQKYSVEVDYASIGSGGGIKQFLEKTVDFGASDAPLPRSEWEKAGDALHIPVVIGAVVVIYNIPDLLPNTRLKFTGQIVADIYLGKITKWNDPALVSLNPQLSNIDKPITVVHRSDGSGTTYVFTQYLSVVSQEWAEKVGYSTSVNWPAPNKIGGKGNEGVAGVVQKTPYTIGYVEFTYAVKNKIPYGMLDNPSTREFVEPTIQTIAKTVDYIALTLPRGDEDWSKVSIIVSFFELVKTNKNLSGAYPVVSFVYVFIYKELSKVPGMTKEKAKALVEFLRWLVKDGQQHAEPLYYIPLPQSVTNLALQTLSMAKFQGSNL
jgi:phosphate transport system permease protein/phosphate transport system substrate-binding protein